MTYLELRLSKTSVSNIGKLSSDFRTVMIPVVSEQLDNAINEGYKLEGMRIMEASNETRFNNL